MDNWIISVNLNFYENLLENIKYLFFIKPKIILESRWGVFIDIKDSALWVIDVDRRLVTIRAFKKEKILHPSDIAKENKRSIQNISRAIHELEAQGILELINEKRTWRKYLLTDKGKKVLNEIEKFYS